MKTVRKKMTLLLVIVFTLTTLFSFSGSAFASAPSDGLVAYYTFDENLKDSTSNGNDGKANKSLSYIDGKAGKAVYFDGSSYIEVNDSNSLDFTKEFTFSVWYKKEVSKSETQPIIEKLGDESTDENPAYTVLDNSQYPYAKYYNKDEFSYDYSYADSRVDIQKWSLLTVVYDGSNVTYYINKELAGVKPFSAELVATTGKLIFGKSYANDNSFFKGWMDEARLYNRALGSAEVGSIYDATAGSSQGGLVAQFTFDNNLNNSVTGGANGTPIGKVGYVDGVLGKAASFDGNCYIEVPDYDGLDVDNAFTFSVWVYMNDLGQNTTVNPLFFKPGSSVSPNEPAYEFYVDDLYPSVKIYNQNNYSLDRSYSQGWADVHQWNLLTVTYDKEKVKFYINDKPIDEKPFTPTVTSSNGKLIIGMSNSSGTTYKYKGYMDDLQIYNKVLLDSEIEGIYNAGKAKAEKPKQQIAYYKFDNSFADSTTFKNNGTGVGKFSYVPGVVGKAVKFNGSSYIEVKDSDSIEIDKSFTISAWIRPEGKGDGNMLQPIVSKAESGFEPGFSAYSLFTEGNVYFHFMNSQNHSDDRTYSTNPVENEKWSLVTVTYDAFSKEDGQNLKFYINGKLDAVKDMDNIITHSFGKLSIGKLLSGGTYFFKGAMDELRIYNYAWKQADVTKAFNYKDTLIVTPKPSKTAINMRRSQSTKLNVKVKSVENGRVTDVTSTSTYTTSNKEAVTVDNSGVLRTVGRGSATITVTYGVNSVKYTINVN